MTIKRKLYSVSFTTILLLLIVSTIAINNVSRIHDSIKEIKYHEDLMIAYNDIAFHTVRSNAAIRGYMIYRQESMLKNHFSIRDEVNQSIDRVKQLGGETPEFQQFETDFKAWKTSIDNKILALLEHGKMEEAHAASLPILGEGSTNLVQFAKKMANEQNDAISEKMSLVENEGKWIITLTVTVSIIALLLSVPFVLILARKITRNIRSFAASVTKVAEGDFTTRINIETNDELGELGDTINTMSNKLQTTMQEIISSSEKLAATSEELSASSYEVSEATVVVTESIHSMHHNLENQSKDVHDVSGFISNIASEINQITGNVELVNESAVNTTNLSKAGQGYVRDVRDLMEMITNKTDNISGVIHNLDEKTNKIVNMNTLITGITEQTNLLALNASIEASRAGEHGKGFAIVANEVRKLAEQSREASQQISELVQQVLNETKQAVSEMDDHNNVIHEGKNLIDQTGTAFNEIHQAITYVSKQIKDITDGINQIKRDANQFVDSVHSINNLSNQSSTHMNSIVSSSEEQSASMEQIAAAISDLSDMAGQLRESLNKFVY